MLLSTPALQVGWLHDDFIHRAMLSGADPGFQRSSHELYCFSGGPRGYAPSQFEPWWRSPQTTSCFFRPLSSLSLAWDHKAFAEHPFLAHLHGLAWFVILCAAVYCLGRKLFDPATATLALMIYGGAGFSGTAVGWVASRHTLISAALSAWGLLAYIHGRQSRRPLFVSAGFLLLLAALLGGEGALGGLGYVLAYELWCVRDTLRLRVLHAAGSALLGVGYVGFYAHSRYGAAHSGAYLDPLRHPQEYLLALPGRLLCLVGEVVFGVPSALWSFSDRHIPLATIGVLGIALVVTTYRLGTRPAEPARRATLSFLGSGALLGAIPAVAAVMGGRVLMLPAVGLALLFAAILLPPVQARTDLSEKKQRLARLAALGMALGLLVLNPVSRLAQTRLLAQLAKSEQGLRDAWQISGCGAAQDYLLIGSNEFTVGMYGPFLLPGLTADKSWHQLTLASSDVDLVRIDERTLRISDASQRPLLGGLLFALFHASADPLMPASGGVKLRLQAAASGSLRIDQEGPHGPTALRIELPGNLDDRRYCWLRYDGERLVSITLPAPALRSRIPYAAGPMSRSQ